MSWAGVVLSQPIAQGQVLSLAKDTKAREKGST